MTFMRAAWCLLQLQLPVIERKEQRGSPNEDINHAAELRTKVRVVKYSMRFQHTFLVIEVILFPLLTLRCCDEAKGCLSGTGPADGHASLFRILERSFPYLVPLLFMEST